MKSVLVVEDDAGQLKALQLRLQEEGLTVFTATTVVEALDVCRNNTPDLILLDIMLPGGQNGFDFLEQIHHEERLASIPVIVATNLDSEQEVSKVLGVTGYYIKSQTSLDQLIASVLKQLETVQAK